MSETLQYPLLAVLSPVLNRSSFPKELVRPNCNKLREGRYGLVTLYMFV